MPDRYYHPGWWMLPGLIAGVAFWILAIIGLVCLLSARAEAQPCAVPPGATELLTAPSNPTGDSDQIVLAPHPEATASVCFYNHVEQVSNDGEFQIEMNGLPVTVQVNFTDLDHEEIIVTPPPGYWVIPDIIGTARDGESVTLLIIMGVS